MSLLLPLLSFFFGLFLGSFLLVVADRSSCGRSFLFGRSECDSCHHPLSWYELVPVISFMIQGAKCRHCHTQLSMRYPFAELLTGLFFAVLTLSSQSPFDLLLSFIIAACLLVIFFADVKYEIIPLPAVIIASITAALLFIPDSSDAIIPHFITGIAAGAFFLTIFLVTRGRGMGFGDVIYACFMGFLLGFPAIIFGLYIAFLTGAAFALILVLLRKKKLRGGTVPFGPFLVLGTFVMMIWNKEILEFVSKFLGVA